MQSRTMLFLVLILAVCLTQMASDIYAPCIPSIAYSFAVRDDLVQLSMSAYMLAVALSQLIYGPLSEAIGRKHPLSLGLIIMIVGSILCFLANNIELFIIGRFIQGCGAGACASLWRPIFRDSFSGKDLAQYSSYAVIFITFIVPGSPLLGAYLQDLFSWRANCAFMVIYSLLALIGIILGFKETNNSFHISKLNLANITKNYKILLTSRLFMGIAFSTFLSYGAFFAWFVVGPVLLIEKIGMLPQTFGWTTFLGGGVAYALAGQINGKLVKTLGTGFMMRFGWATMLLSGIIMIILYFLLGINLWAIIIPVIIFYFGSTFIWPNAFATAFTPFGDIAGYAGALYGFMQICGAAVLACLVAYLPANTQLPFAIIIIVSSAGAWLIYEQACKKIVT